MWMDCIAQSMPKVPGRMIQTSKGTFRKGDGEMDMDCDRL